VLTYLLLLLIIIIVLSLYHTIGDKSKDNANIPLTFSRRPWFAFMCFVAK